MRPRLNHLQEYLAQEFVDDYNEGQMTRREMVKRLLGITGGIAATATLLSSLGCSPAPAGGAASPTAGAASTPTGAPAATPTTAAKPTAAATASSAPVAQASPTLAASASTPVATSAARTPGATPASGTPATTPRAVAKLSVPADDPAVQASDVTFSDSGVTYMAYLAQPKKAGALPAVLVCHENRGLTDHVRDVARRLAKEGYVGLALDLLSREGGTAKVDPGQVPGLLSANPARAVTDFEAAFDYLESHQAVDKDRIGMVGFCFGGGITWLVATAIPDLKAAVPYYGPNPPLADVPKIKAAMLAMYGEQDSRINAGIPAIEEAMKSSGKTYEKRIYSGAGHAFNNDTGAAYNEQAAVDAWAKTLDWFKRYLV